MKYSEAVTWAKSASIRPWIVQKLLDHLIDSEHPLTADCPDKAALKDTLRTRVIHRYGDKEFCPCTITVADDAAPPQQQPEGPQTKQATPAAADSTGLLTEAFGGDQRPNYFSTDYASEQLPSKEAAEVAQLGQCTVGMTVRTGNDFLDQWQPRFLSWAFPYSLPSRVGGPDYPNKTRDRRPDEAPVLGPVAHLQTLARRVENIDPEFVGFGTRGPSHHC